LGKRGYLNILTPDGKLFASGDGATKILAISMKLYPDFQLLKRQLGRAFERKAKEGELLVVSAQLPQPFQWIVTVEQPISEAYALSFAMTRQLIIVVIVFLFLIVSVGLVLGNKQFAKPIAQIMRRIREIASGKIKGEVHIKGEGEFTELANTLNYMSDELIRIQDELVIKEKHALLGQIASSIAHDIKHPIKNIENYTKLLEKKYTDEEYRKRFIQTVKGEFEKINIFLENLKDLTKEIPFKPVKNSLIKIGNNIIEILKPNFEKNHIKINKTWNSDAIVSIDLFSFQRVVTNLIHNAIEAMPQGGMLSFELEKNESDKKAIFKIRDTGLGISEDKLKTLFNDFVTTKRSGLGLGLAISKKIIDQHGGTIKVESQVDVGTCFCIELPSF